MNNQNSKRNILISVAAITVCIVLLFALGIGKLTGVNVQTEQKPEKSFAVINVMFRIYDYDSNLSAIVIIIGFYSK